MLYLLGCVYIVFYMLPSVVLSLLQLRHIRRKLGEKPVILPHKEWSEAGHYSLEKLKFSVIKDGVETIVFLLWLFVLLPRLEGLLSASNMPEILQWALCVMIFFFIGSIFSFPINFYSVMVLDKKYGFTKSSLGLFIKDAIKELVMLLLIVGVISLMLIWVMSVFVYWWLYGFALVFAIAVLFNTFYPILIAPIFNKFTPLNDENLRERIESMMTRVGFKSKGIFVMDASKRDGRLNAYFGGLGNAKRVVLFDTLLEKVSQDGLLAILGHELGHFKHKDIIKNIAVMAVLMFVLFFIMGNLPTNLFTSLGVSQNPATTIIFLLLISPIVSFWAMPIMGIVSRKAEYRADEYGSQLTSKRSLAEALIRLVNENKSFPCSHPAYIFFHFSHPPLFERLKALNYETGK